MNSRVFLFKCFILLALSFLGIACTTTHFIYQATKGQLSLANRARPIDEVLRDRRVSPRIKDLLSRVDEVKTFGEENGLTRSSNYTEYVQLDRPYVVWVVSASESLAFRSRTWSFPVVGSFTYLGWFNQDDADEHARDLKEEGLDVYVRGATAYSTLGWFRDAILSSMIRKREGAFGNLVNVILHESVHATLYVSHQSIFNESVATFVADGLTLEYLDKKMGKNSKEYQAYQRAEERGKKRRKRFHRAYQDLKALYQSSVSEEQKLAQKKAIIDTLKMDLKIKKEVNNATLIQFKTYREGMNSFDRLYQSCGRSFIRMLKVMENLKSDDFGKEHQTDLTVALEPLVQKRCDPQ